METQEVFAIDPELAGPTPRSVRYRRDTKITRCALLAILIVSITLVLDIAKHNLDDLRLLNRQGVVTQGMILNKRAVPGGRSPAYEVDYSYYTGQKTIHDTLTISSQEYQDTQTGDPITVTYLPSRPTLHQVGTVTEDDVATDEARWAGFLFCTFAMIGGIFAYAEMQYREHLKLLRDGQVALGTIISRRIIENRSPTYCLTYQFAVDGRTRKREIVVSRTQYDMWPEGTQATILYDAGNLSNNTAYQLLPDVMLNIR